MSGYVVDASVVAKWFVEESESVAAERVLQEDLTLSSPDLLFAEVGNILWKKARRGEISEYAGQTILNTLKRARIRIYRSSSVQLLSLAFQLAVEAQTTFYDSLYVALAIQIGLPLVTADRRLTQRFGETRYAPHVVWIGNVP